MWILLTVDSPMWDKWSKWNLHQMFVIWTNNVRATEYRLNPTFAKKTKLWLSNNNMNGYVLKSYQYFTCAEEFQSDLMIMQITNNEMGTFSALLSLCQGYPPVTGGFLWQRPVTRSFDFFYLPLNKRLTKQPGRQWFETHSCFLWPHCSATRTIINGDKINTYIRFRLEI